MFEFVSLSHICSGSIASKVFEFIFQGILCGGWLKVSFRIWEYCWKVVLQINWELLFEFLIYFSRIIWLAKISIQINFSTKKEILQFGNFVRFGKYLHLSLMWIHFDFKMLIRSYGSSNLNSGSFLSIYFSY